VSGRENLVEMMFIDRNAAGIEFGDALAIDVRADYLVTCFGKTSSGDQADVSTTDDGKTQDKPSHDELRRAGPYTKRDLIAHCE